MIRCIKETEAIELLSEDDNLSTDDERYDLAIAISEVPTANVPGAKMNGIEDPSHTFADSVMMGERCEGCKHLGNWENEAEYGYPSPCTCCKRKAEDHYE